MPTIETQGLSDSYEEATGEFQTIERGILEYQQILDILRNVVNLNIPEGEDECPPNVNVKLTNDGSYICFMGDSGVIRCLESRQEEMSPEEAAKII